MHRARIDAGGAQVVDGDPQAGAGADAIAVEVVEACECAPAAGERQSIGDAADAVTTLDTNERDLADRRRLCVTRRDAADYQ